MSKLEQPSHTVISRKQRLVVTSSSHKKVTVVISEERKPFSLTISLQSGMTVRIDKRGNAEVFVPKTAELF